MKVYKNELAHPFFTLLLLAIVLLFFDILTELFFTIMLFSSVVAVFFIRVLANISIQNGESVLGSILRKFTFIPLLSIDRSTHEPRTIPWGTVGLMVSISIVSFWYWISWSIPILPFSPWYLLFPTPLSLPNHSWSMPFSLFTSIFLHADGEHLFWNLAFIYTFGSVLEERIGGRQTVALFILTGVAANLFSLIFHLFTQEGFPNSGLGASGGVMGLMAAFAVRCYFKNVNYPLPANYFFFPLPLPIFMNLKVSSVLLVGIYIFCDYRLGVAQLNGQDVPNIGYWPHFFGYLSGFGASLVSGLYRQGVQEKRLEAGRKFFAGNQTQGDIPAIVENYNRTLNDDPENVEALLGIARIESRYRPTEEGEAAYLPAINTLYKTNKQAAAEVYKEYFLKYHKHLGTDMAYAFGKIFTQKQDYIIATSCFEFVLTDEHASNSQHATALFHLGDLCEKESHSDAACIFYQQFLERFPQSELYIKVKNRLHLIETNNV